MSGYGKIGRVVEPKYGRLLEDFQVGETYHHPWEVTVDEGALALFAASFIDPNPLYSSRRFARELGFRDRVVPPMVLLNMALSFTVHDVSEQTIAHLAYMDLKFPNAAYAGDTISARSKVVGVRASQSKPDRGIVHVRTTAVNQDGAPVVTFERKALIPAGRLANRAHPDSFDADEPQPVTGDLSLSRLGVPVQVGNLEGEVGAIPREIAIGINIPKWRGRPSGLFEDFEPGDIYLHDVGRTVGESEHMRLAMLSRNSHPLHYDEVYCEEHGFQKTRVVCGGLVFAWAASLASRDTTANALWELCFNRGGHPQPVVAGDTLYSASFVVDKHDYNDQSGIVRFHLVCVKNVKPAALLKSGLDLVGGKMEQKVFEVDRAVLLPKRSAVSFA